MAFDVLLAQPELLGSPALSQALAKASRIPFQDAARAARGSWGFLAQGLEQSAAEELAERLGEAGVKALALAQDKIPALPPAASARRLTLDGSGGFSPSDVRLIAAAGFKRTQARSIEVKEGPTQAQKMMSMGLMMATGLPIKIGGKEQTVRKTVEDSELVFLLDLWLAGAPGRVRADSQDLDYSSLKERMLPNVFGNFKLLVKDAVKACPSAALNRGAAVLAQDRPIREMGYETPADLEKESRWLAALRQTA